MQVSVGVGRPGRCCGRQEESSELGARRQKAQGEAGGSEHPACTCFWRCGLGAQWWFSFGETDMAEAMQEDLEFSWAVFYAGERGLPFLISARCLLSVPWASQPSSGLSWVTWPCAWWVALSVTASACAGLSEHAVLPFSAVNSPLPALLCPSLLSSPSPSFPTPGMFSISQMKNRPMILIGG